jgi:hypothetical protein
LGCFPPYFFLFFFHHCSCRTRHLDAEWARGELNANLSQNHQAPWIDKLDKNTQTHTMMVHFTTVHEIPRAFILFLSLTHIYYNASFLRRDITQQNTISLTECNLSFPLEQPNQKRNLFPNLNATQIALSSSALESVTLFIFIQLHYSTGHHQSSSGKTATTQKIHTRRAPHPFNKSHQ